MREERKQVAVVASVWLVLFAIYLPCYLIYHTGLLFLGLAALIGIAVEAIFVGAILAERSGRSSSSDAFDGEVDDRVGLALCCLLAGIIVFLWGDEITSLFPANRYPIRSLEEFLSFLSNVLYSYPVDLYEFIRATYESCQPTGDEFVGLVLAAMLVPMSLVLLVLSVFTWFLLLVLVMIAGMVAGVVSIVGLLMTASPIASVVGRVAISAALGTVLYGVFSRPVRFVTGATIGEYVYRRRVREAQRILAGEGWVRLRNPVLLVIALLLVAIGLLWIFRGGIGW